MEHERTQHAVQVRSERTWQFIERAMRENHGYTVPARWLADLDAIPDGDTGEPESGYLVPLPPKPRTPGHADGGTRSNGKASNN